MGKKIRILQFLLRTGKFHDSNQVIDLIRKGKVKVGGREVFTPNFEFRPSTKKVTLDGEVLEGRKDHVYLALHKPEGILCQKNDAEGRPNVWQWLEKYTEIPKSDINSLVTVGRLDIDTEGLLLMTTDGDLVNEVLQPESKVAKQYYAILEGKLTEKLADKLRNGLEISIKLKGRWERMFTLPAEVRIISSSNDESKASITIVEGKKRQVKAMFRQVGTPVVYLRREKIGNLDVKTIPQGKIRMLTREDIERLILARDK